MYIMTVLCNANILLCEHLYTLVVFTYSLHIASVRSCMYLLYLHVVFYLHARPANLSCCLQVEVCMRLCVDVCVHV